MKWITLTEENYAVFCNSIENMDQCWNDIVKESTSDNIEKNMKLKIIYDLFFYGLRYCALSKLRFEVASGVWELIQDELEYLALKKDYLGASIFENSTADIADSSKRYQLKIDDLLFRGVMSPQEAMKTTDFFTEEVVAFQLEYKYIMKELHTEEYEIIPLEVQLPMSFSPLNNVIQS